MVSLDSTPRHSAVVRMTLETAGQSIRVAQMGPDFLILKESVELPPCSGIVTLEVDDSIQTFEVNFPNGISHGKKRVEIEGLE
jgi:hypothetical protein